MDIRLYYYSTGTMKKIPGNNNHFFKNEVDCRNYINNLPDRWNGRQFIITKYSGKYKSKILNIINK